MTFRATDKHIDDYHMLGYCVFEGIVPLSLLKDLRREADKGRVIARQRGGESAQRLQPICKFEVDPKPFVEFANLPEINDALRKVIGPKVHYGGRPQDKTMYLGVLYEPEKMPWCTQWHRDWRDNAPGLDIRTWERRQLEMDMFNQVNCALYEDSATWVVPGSHLRRDTPGEIRRFPQRPVPGPTIPDGATAEERERICLDYCRSMPGALQTYLNAGDFLLYRNALWHLGNYVPYRRRATIHDVIGSEEFSAWFSNPPMLKDKDGKNLPMQNANLDTPEYKEWAATQPA